MIQKVKKGYRVLSEKGRNMGTYKTEEPARNASHSDAGGEAKKRLQQVEYFKHKKKS